MPFTVFTENPYLISLVWVIVIIATAVVLERIITRWFKRIIKRTEMPPEVGNGLILTGRLIILIGATVAFMHLGGVPTDIIFSFSALGGAAVGFASTRTIGNLIAGLFILVTRPFHVGDFVRIDGVEGIVVEITLNYTKILTIAGNVASISTQRVLDKDIINFRFRDEESNLFCYGFELGFDHRLSTEKLEKVIDNTINRYAKKLPRKPEYKMIGTTSFAKRYIIYIYVENPEDIFTFYPLLAREITQAWDEVVTQKS